MVGYLGEDPVLETTVQGSSLTTTGGQAEVYVKEMTSAVKDLAQNQAQLQQYVRQTKVESSKVLDDFDVAALKAWCGVQNPGQVPAFWALVKLSKNVGSARENLMREMNLWAKETGHELNYMYFTDDQMKDFMANNPNPGIGAATLKGAERGVSNMICMPQTAQEIQELMIRDEAKANTTDTRTYTEAIALSKSNTIKPPTNYYVFRNTLNTTTALVFALYGVNCPLYQDLLDIVDILVSDDVKRANFKGFTASWCAMASWAIYEECRSFFAKRLLPQDFLRQDVRYPRSLLSALFTSIRWQEPIHRPNFPYLWQQGYKNLTARGLAGGGMGGYGGDDDGPARYHRPQGSRKPGTGTDSPNKAALGADADHVHPIIKKAMAPVMQKFGGKITILEMMDAAKVGWRDMPMLEKCKNSITGYCEVCWNHLCGKCRFGEKCDFAKNHLPAEEVPDKFATEVVNVLTPGLKELMKDNYDRDKYKRQRDSGEAGSARVKRERK
jgi:hypothetical protein